jgi:hypothetical protein
MRSMRSVRCERNSEKRRLRLENLMSMYWYFSVVDFRPVLSLVSTLPFRPLVAVEIMLFERVVIVGLLLTGSVVVVD